MKVAIFSGEIPSTTFVEHLINGLGAEGVEVLLFGKYIKSYSPKYPSIKVYYSPVNKIEILVYTVRQLLFLIFKDFKLARKIPTILKEVNRKSLAEKVIILSRVLQILVHKPDIFHLQWAKAIEDYFWVKSILNITLVVSLRGAQINSAPIADKALAETFKNFFLKVDFFHGVSEAILKEGAKYGVDFNRSMVIRPAVQKSLLNYPLNNKNKKTTLSILSVGRFHWKKGYHYALDAMAILLAKKIDFLYTIVAGGEHEEITFQISNLGLKNKLTIIDNLPHHEVIKKMAEADLFLLPSVEEGIANVVLESMAIGTPVISTDCGGMVEVVENNRNGFLVPVRDSEAIAEAVVKYKGLDQQEIENLQKNARETIVQGHLVENQIKSFQKLYRIALNRDN